jgi:predicted permease
MRRVRAWFIRITGIFNKSKRDRELSDELESHLQLHIDDNLRAGMSPTEARRRAIIKLGGIESTKENYRDRRSIPIIETTLQDIRYGTRSLVKTPGFTAVALLSLTLGIGGTTTIFTLVKAVFLQSIPVKDPSTAIVVYATQQTADGKVLQYMQSSYLNSKDYREKNDVFTGLSLFTDAAGQLSVSNSGNPVFVDVQLVNWDFFDILGVRPAIGRTFVADEDKIPGARPVAMLSYALWNTQFGADPNILGRTIRINEQDFNAIGVMPKELQQMGDLGSPDIWVPMMMHHQLLPDMKEASAVRRQSWFDFMVGRLKPGVSLAQATASMQAIGTHLAQEYPREDAGRNVQLIPLSETNVPPDQRSVFVLAGTLMMAIVGLVLLIACGNVANLLLSRAMQRRREFAVRLSLGASRGRLIRQLLTESLLLGLIAAALGILCAYWGRDILWKLWPGGKPQNLDFSLDARVLLFTLGLSLLATLLFGLVPSLQASKPEQMTCLRDRTDGPSGSSRWYGLRGLLVAAQIAFSLIALVSSALFIHSLRNAQQTNPGFETKNELLVVLNPAAGRYPQSRAEQYYFDATEKVRALPMVAAVGISNSLPFGANVAFTSFPEGVDTSDARHGSLLNFVAVGPGYFSAAGIPLLRGRDINEHDSAQTDHVVVINQALADYLWKGQDPIGKRLSFASQPWKAEVVGVVETVKAHTLGESPQPLMYFSLKQVYFPTAILNVHTKGDADRALPNIRSTVQSLDPTLKVARAFTVSWLIDQMLVRPRFAAELLAGFGGLALLLASVGTYGVMAYSVRQRTQEIGIRVALGAQRGDVLRLILGNGMAMVLAGVTVGLGVTAIFTRSISTLLYGIGSFDATSFLAAAIVLLAVALVACWLPARHAMRVDPMVALRYE